MLLFYSLYRFARLFLHHGGSLFCLALWTVVFPVSFRYYAGQLTDPLSHLSFVLAFIFIETEQFVYLLLTVMIGCLVKESIVAMAGYYAFFRWREKSYLSKTILLVLGSVVVCVIARVWCCTVFQIISKSARSALNTWRKTGTMRYGCQDCSTRSEFSFHLSWQAGEKARGRCDRWRSTCFRFSFSPACSLAGCAKPGISCLWWRSLLF